EVVKRLEKALQLQLAHENRLAMAEPKGKFAGKRRFRSRFRSLRIELEAIKSATNNFDDAHCIGKGGFGKVYKGELVHPNGRSVVALKRLDRAFGQGNPEFWKEVIMLSLYKHDNIVSLLGFCDDCGEMILVYEYASKRSLDLYLNDKDLTWVRRLEICIGAARGLAYLHNPGRTHQRVLHRDIKSSNILLDDNWNAKIADLGLSKFGPANQKYTFLVSNAVGTIGIGNSRDECQPLTELVRKCYKQNTMDEIIYGNIKDEINPDSLKAFTTIAYQCLMREQEQRPLMTKVVKVLESALQLQVSFRELEFSWFSSEPHTECREFSGGGVWRDIIKVGREIDGVGIDFTSFHLDSRLEGRVVEKGRWVEGVWRWEWLWTREPTGRVGPMAVDPYEDGGFTVKDLTKMFEERTLQLEISRQDTIWNKRVPKKWCGILRA
ncbi:protein kinase, ATP binding site-containing protein, partial [Tanacetum coccineum]